MVKIFFKYNHYPIELIDLFKIFFLREGKIRVMNTDWNSPLLEGWLKAGVVNDLKTSIYIE
ncbi:hypothetical protein Q766_08505 [Flavobacterium subsaxonicum WB 4.1-42 = DSM 21790]|uniref:Uncharacterized protein n=1 Tax=Flavobacterium subsaxonicum WB 4.1-42 = DSM 21790 TaxID=1121898 RepID=A0A0A2MP34_9FLAO|nr:hypothetical protein Q766_08505 [Flavobacterium subsaxonicum WB 4.1-42 = DSM 21790]